MADNDMESFIKVRHAQTAAAIAAIGVDGFALQPLFSSFGAELLTDYTLASTAGFPSLSLATRSSGPHAAERLGNLLANVYQTHPKVGGLATKLCEAFDWGAFHLAVTEQVKAPRSEPGLALSWEGGWSQGQVQELLEQVRIDPEVLSRFQTLRGRLTVDKATRFGFRMATPSSPPVFDITYPWYFAKDDVDQFRAQIGHAAEFLGVSEKQRGWVLGTAASFAPRPMNRVMVTVSVGHDALVNELRITYPYIPAALLMRVLSQFAPVEGSGLKLGAMTAAAGIEAEAITNFYVTARDTEPPGLGFDLRTENLPGAANA